VRDIATAAAEFVQSLQAEWDGNIFSDPLQQVRVTFLTLLPGEAQLELVEPIDQHSPVAAFLQNKGQGLHHLCFEVVDLEKTVSSMRSKGVLLAKPPKPAVAFAGRRIAWLLTRERLLIELLELQRPNSTDVAGKE